MANATIDWEPQPRQRVALRAAGVLGCLERGAPPEMPQARIIGYGGAAGGGKSDVLIITALLWCVVFPGAQVAYFRRKFSELEGADGAIQRSHELFAPLVGLGILRYTGDTHRWTFANGSALTFAHCQHEHDKYNYQGSRWDLLLIDEATHFTWSIVDYLLTRNGPTVDSVLQPLAVLATNPGNIGHLWFREKFVDRRPREKPHDVPVHGDITERVLFIQALLKDNQILDRRAGGAYRRTLEARDTDTRRALLDGDWDVFVGQFFKEFSRQRHVIEPLEDIPAHWPRFSGTDWGYNAPFSTHWLAQNPDSGRVYVYRELYERGLTDRAQARLIKSVTPPDEKIRARFADPSMWTKDKDEDRTVSTYDIYKSEGVLLTKADNDRMSGWRRLRTFLADLPDGRPGLLIYETCENLIRTIGALPYSRTSPEDLDTDAEDHAVDSLRYATTSISPLPRWKTPEQRDLEQRLKIGKAGHIGRRQSVTSGRDF